MANLIVGVQTVDVGKNCSIFTRPCSCFDMVMRPNNLKPPPRVAQFIRGGWNWKVPMFGADFSFSC